MFLIRKSYLTLLILFIFVFTALLSPFDSIRGDEHDVDSSSEETTQTESDTANNQSSYQQELQNKIEEYEKKLDQLGDQKSSLKNEIESLENQIRITEYRIESANIAIQDKIKEIGFLEQDIEFLENRLDRIVESISLQEKIFEKRLREKYKTARVNNIALYLTSSGFNSLLNQIKYNQITQERDQSLLNEMVSTQDSYENQQGILEYKKQDVEAAKVELERQKAESERLKGELDDLQKQKNHLLQVTRNDEQRYQELLDQARSEYEALQAILAGSGIESSGTPVNEGQLIGSVIQGASCNSSGTHLDFGIRKNGTVQNPFKYLKPIDNYSNCSGPGGCSVGDPFNPSGDWPWPLKGHITLTQGYGNTWATQYTWVRSIYTFHSAIDINSSDPRVYSVFDGTYYRGYYTGSNGCRLQYIRVEKEDSDITAYYLHVNY